MKNLTLILALSYLLLWGAFVNKYCIRPMSIPIRAYPHNIGQRVDYVERSKGNALWLVLYLNQSMQSGALEPGPVYGIWLEDLRVYADFPLVGNIYGWGSLYNVADCESPGELAAYLRSVGCRYIMWDGARARYIALYMSLRVLQGMNESDNVWEWAESFERVPIPQNLRDTGCEVLKCKP